jgi:hypothetical protein
MSIKLINVFVLLTKRQEMLMALLVHCEIFMIVANLLFHLNGKIEKKRFRVVLPNREPFI